MAVTTPSEMLSFMRRDLDDLQSPYLWSDADLYYFMDEIQKEFARETRCITDGTTFTDIAVDEDEPLISRDPAIIDIKRATLGTSTVLNPSTVEELSRYTFRDDYGLRVSNAWESDTGSPTHIILNMDEDSFRLYPIPSADTTMDLIVWREPISTIEDANSSFEIPARWVRYLIPGIKWMAYQRQDFDAFDGDESDRQFLLWENNKAEARSRTKQLKRRPRRSAYGGY